MKKISKEFKQKIDSKIKTIELASSVEIVPVIFQQSSKYMEWMLFISLFAYSFAFTVFSVLDLGWSSGAVSLMSLAVSILFFLILFFDKGQFKRHFIPKILMHQAVENNAKIYFLENELFETLERSALLIVISEMERSVFLLADKGLIEVIPEESWAQYGKVLARDLSLGNAGETFIRILDEISPTLVKNFPVGPTNPNELSDQLIEN